MSGPHVRRYEPSDREALVALWLRVFPDPPARNDPDRNIDRKVAEGDQLLLVAVEEGKLVGATMVGYDGHRGWLYLVAVDPDCRKRGIGRGLVEASCERLRELGCPKVNLQILGTNDEVVGFYRALGFAVEDRISMGYELGAPGC